MKKLKKLVLLISVLTLALAMTACGEKKSSNSKVSEYEDEFVNSVVVYTETILEYSSQLEEIKETLDEEDKTSVALVNAMEQVNNSKEETGKYIGFDMDENQKLIYQITEDKDTVTISMTAEFEKRDVKIEYTFDSKKFEILNIKFEPVYSLAEKMKTAGLNTVTGIGVVVVVLAFLSIVISLFGLINKAEIALANKKNQKSESTFDSTFEQIATKEEIEEEVDDLEVIAVITAAIAAMEQTSTDGFVVRSIKRVPQRKWNRGI